MSMLMLILLMLVPHELGHVLSVYAVGAKVRRIGIDRRGPYVLRSPAATPLRNALVSLAGPAANILTSIVLLASHSSHAWFPLCFGLFNLLPFPHSDGIHTLNAFKGENPPVARTRIEIEEELEALRNLRGQVPPQTAFGDDNQEAIDAQVRVIEELMDYDETLEAFEDTGDYVLSNAQDAVRWLRDDDEPVSESWRDLANVEVEAVA